MDGAPRFIVLVCCRTKLPFRPFSVPVTLSVATYPAELSRWCWQLASHLGSWPHRAERLRGRASFAPQPAFHKTARTRWLTGSRYRRRYDFQSRCAGQSARVRRCETVQGWATTANTLQTIPVPALSLPGPARQTLCTLGRAAPRFATPCAHPDASFLPHTHRLSSL